MVKKILFSFILYLITYSSSSQQFIPEVSLKTLNGESIKSIEAIINSMTPKERSNPEILNGSRRKRIAIGSGNSVSEVNKLIKQFSQMSKMMKMMQGGGKNRVMDMFNNQIQRR